MLPQAATSVRALLRTQERPTYPRRRAVSVCMELWWVKCMRVLSPVTDRLFDHVGYGIGPSSHVYLVHGGSIARKYRTVIGAASEVVGENTLRRVGLIWNKIGIGVYHFIRRPAVLMRHLIRSSIGMVFGDKTDESAFGYRHERKGRHQKRRSGALLLLV